MFCFVRRVGGHHDDRVEHKRGAPEGVTGHKILRSPFYAGVYMSGLAATSHIKRIPASLALRSPCSSTVTADPPFRPNLSYDRGARLNRPPSFVDPREGIIAHCYLREKYVPALT